MGITPVTVIVESQRACRAAISGMANALYRLGLKGRCVMIRKRHWFWITPVFLTVALSSGPVGAADKSKVEKGAKQIGQGQVGPGFKEMFTGVGHTIVEGAKFSGENIKEFFSSKK
jgi:hypothetical protein